MLWGWSNQPLNIPADGGGICGGVVYLSECGGSYSYSSDLTANLIISPLTIGSNYVYETAMNVDGYGVRNLEGSYSYSSGMEVGVDTTFFVTYEP